MEYKLKDKLSITKEFLKELELKSWQEIEHLQNQIANIEATEESLPLIQLLKSLLTSYYVFAGGLENLSVGETFAKAPIINNIKEPTIKKVEEFNDDEYFSDPVLDSQATAPTAEVKVNEPFEYFVDFDDPIGDPLTDEDLYNS